MVINNFENDYKILKGKSGKTQQGIADLMGIAQPSVSRIAKGKIIPQGFVELCEALGYDIKVIYVRREDNHEG